MTDFIGRERELRKLKELLQKKSASFVVIHGRRRIGKSRLIQEFGKNMKSLVFSGLPPTSKTTDQSQRDEFAKQMALNLKMPTIKSENWNDLFWHLAQQTNKGRLLLVFDEISWIGSKDPDFLGKLKNFWDLHLSKNQSLIFIVCGSISTWIEQNILTSTGFLGRISLDLVIHELPLSDCRLFWNHQERRISSYEIFKVLAVTGGIPKYLEEIIPRISAEENIRRLCFQPDGLLFREFDQIFSDLFSKKATTFSHIVHYLADAPLSLDELCKFLKWEKSGNISDYLKELILAGFISSDPTWNIRSKKISRLKKFRLSDNYLRFYIKYIYPNKEQIIKGLYNIKSLSSLPSWKTITGLQFENLVLNNYQKLFQLLEINPNDVIMFGPFFQRPTLKQKGCQIDLLIQTNYSLYLSEIKSSSSEINSKILQELKEKLNTFSIPKGISIRPVLIHINGVSDHVKESGIFDYIIDFSDLLL